MTPQTRIAAVIPTRNNRPDFLAQCLRYLEKQTLPADKIYIVDYQQTVFPTDLKFRYRDGFEAVRESVDLIFLIEDDDFYPANYFEKSVKMWESLGRPDLFGCETTIYYHLFTRAYWKDRHAGRASAFATAISSRAAENVIWESIDPLWVDIGLWRQVPNRATYSEPLAIGIKHGIGKCGGVGHNRQFYRRRPNVFTDPQYAWLRENTDRETFEFFMQQVRKGNGAERVLA